MEIFGAMKPEYSAILSKDALDFVAKLARKYTNRWGGGGAGAGAGRGGRGAGRARGGAGGAEGPGIWAAAWRFWRHRQRL